MNTCEVVTERIIKILESGTIPWRKPWSETGTLGTHQNLISQHAYRGINAILTASMGFSTPYWLTYKQALEHGGVVKAGEKGCPIVYWAFGTDEKADGTERKWAFCKYSTVFNLDQVDGLDSIKLIAAKRKAQRIEFKPIEQCEAVVKGYPIAIHHREQRAYYRPDHNYVNMPKPESFNSVENYYATLFHELGHSTGHESLLNRFKGEKQFHFGSHDYSKEELIAEMTSAFLCSKTGIDGMTVSQSAAYIQSWIKVLKGDPKLVLSAASQAQKAFDLILGVKVQEA